MSDGAPAKTGSESTLVISTTLEVNRSNHDATITNDAQIQAIGLVNGQTVQDPSPKRINSRDDAGDDVTTTGAGGIETRAGFENPWYYWSFVVGRTGLEPVTPCVSSRPGLFATFRLEAV